MGCIVLYKVPVIRTIQNDKIPISQNLLSTDWPREVKRIHWTFCLTSSWCNKGLYNFQLYSLHKQSILMYLGSSAKIFFKFSNSKKSRKEKNVKDLFVEHCFTLQLNRLIWNQVNLWIKYLICCRQNFASNHSFIVTVHLFGKFEGKLNSLLTINWYLYYFLKTTMAWEKG